MIYEICSNGSKHIRCLKTYCLSVKEFNKLMESRKDTAKGVVVLGEVTSLWGSKKKDKYETSVYVNKKNKYLEVKKYDSNHKYRGYLCIDKDNYIGIRRLFLPFLIFFFFAFVYVGIMLYLSPKITITKKTDANALVIEEGMTKPDFGDTDFDSNIVIAGLDDFEAVGQDKYIEFNNPDVNTVYLQYEVKLNNEVVYQTDAIQPGNLHYWDVISTFHNPGTYPVTIVIHAFDIETQKEVNGVVQTINVTIK